MHRLVAQQLAEATDAAGRVDIDRFAELVSRSYDQTTVKRTLELQAREAELRSQNVRFEAALMNMTQALLLYDDAARLVICNQRYIDMYGLSPDVVKPGCSFRDLISHRKETGSFKGDVDQFCAQVLRNVAEGKVTRTVVEASDGRAILIVNKPLADGGWLTTQEDITERRRSEERIARLAHYDVLTDLPNRVLFRTQLEESLKYVERGERIAVLYIDIDEFKSVNDTLGHAVGDELLKVIADCLRGCVRKSDIVARLGGDEFAIIQTAPRDSAEIIALVTRIHEAIRVPHECGGHLLSSDASVGIAVAPEDGTDLDDLLKNADLAMYGAKSDGRRTYRFFEPDMHIRVNELRTLEHDLREAIASGGLEIHYQPLVNLRDGVVAACEALLRWPHPKLGMVSPTQFIPIAEETGLINELGEWVLSTACVQAATWPHQIKLAINISPVQFRSRTLALKVAAALASSGLSANRLELEITEAVLIRDDTVALATLNELKQLGVRIALDDFGTGYSSLSYLHRFPFDKIKIDRSFIRDIAESGGSSYIVQAVVSIAAAHKMVTTAEGVEIEEQLEILRKLDCTEMQGYLFSPAVPAEEILQLLRQHPVGSAAVQTKACSG